MKFNKDIQDSIRKRLFISIGILLFIRIGTFLPVPGINHTDLAFYIQRHSLTRSLLSTFSGDDTFIIGLFTLNIFPYINASIFMQIIVSFYPQLSKLQKEGDLEGRRSINRLTRLITLIWAIIQSVSIAIYLKQVLFDWNYFLAFQIVIWLTTGAIIILWLSELITDYGLGNGPSLIIYTNIISSLPNFYNKSIAGNIENITISSILLISLFIFVAVYGTVFLQEGVRKIPLLSSKQLNQMQFYKSSLKELGIANNYIPLRLNQAGVMPIILTTAILVIPNYISNEYNFPINSESLQFVYWIGYFSLILLLSSFYSRIMLNPKDISDQLQKMAVTIPEVRPGLETTFYLKQLMTRATLLGATLLATLATVPNFLESTVNIGKLNGLSTTSLLIVAGVVLDLIREVKNIYFSNIYNNMYQ